MSADHVTGSLLSAPEALQEEDFSKIARGIFDLGDNLTHIGIVDSNGLTLHNRLYKSLSPRIDEKLHRDLHRYYALS
jgi:hypothetical protein